MIDTTGLLEQKETEGEKRSLFARDYVFLII